MRSSRSSSAVYYVDVRKHDRQRPNTYAVVSGVIHMSQTCVLGSHRTRLVGHDSTCVHDKLFFLIDRKSRELHIKHPMCPLSVPHLMPESNRGESAPLSTNFQSMELSCINALFRLTAEALSGKLRTACLPSASLLNSLSANKLLQ